MPVFTNEEVTGDDVAAAIGGMNDERGKADFGGTLMIEFVAFNVHTNKLCEPAIELFAHQLELVVPRRGSAIEFLLRFQVSCRCFGETGVHGKLGFGGHVFDVDVPFSGPEFRVEARWEGGECDAIVFFNVLFQEETLVFREEVFAALGVAVQAYMTRKVSDGEILGRQGAYRLRHPMDLPISRMFGVRRGLQCVGIALDF